MILLQDLDHVPLLIVHRCLFGSSTRGHISAFTLSARTREAVERSMSAMRR